MKLKLLLSLINYRNSNVVFQLKVNKNYLYFSYYNCKDTVDRYFLEYCDFVAYNPQSLSFANAESRQKDIHLPGQDSAIFLKGSFLELEKYVKQKTEKNPIRNGGCRMLVKLGSIALFSN